MTDLRKQAGVAEGISAGFEVFEKSLNGQSQKPLHQVRKAALEQLREIGLPGPKHEEYKYTQISKAFARHFDSAYNESTADLSTLSADSTNVSGLEANKIVFVNGHYRADLSEIISDDLIIMELGAAYKEHQADIDAHLGKYANKPEKDGYTAWNTAFTQEGIFIKVGKGKAIEAPVMIWYLNDASDSKPVMHTRNLVIMEENAQLKMTEWFKSAEGNVSFANTVTEVLVNKHAVIDHYKVLEVADTAYHVGNTHFEQVAESTTNSVVIALSGAMVRNNLNFIIDAEQCEANMYGLYLLSGKSHVDNHTVVDHRKPNSYSNELYKGVMDDSSTGVFNGKIFVRQDAQKTNAFQSNRNILLSDKATINTKPQLEIWADDVKCSHGATTGRLDEEQLFYLRARGVDAETARAILLYAFAKDVLENIRIEALREHLDTVIGARLGQ